MSTRTYGGWRRARGVGLLGLGIGGTSVVLVCVVLPLLLVNKSVKLALLSLPISAIIIALLVTRIQGVPIGDLIFQRIMWWWGTTRGYSSLRAGVVVEHPRAWQLPGVLAPTELISAEDPAGYRFGIVWDKRSGMLTATLNCSAASTWLVDTPDADGWVSAWHSWLAGLGYLPMVSHVAVTVDTAPEPGSTLADNVYARMDPNAPEDARGLLHELVWRSPAAAADVDTRVSITFDPRRASMALPSLADQAAEVSRVLVGLEDGLNRCGVAVLGRATELQLAGAVRTAFDPAARGEVNRLLNRVEANDAVRMLGWGEAGPVAAEESWDSYRHDSGTSVSWAWQEAPRQHVTSDVLARLMAPGRYPKRVTMLYRATPAGAAARMLEGQVNAASFREQVRRMQKRDETARDRADRSLAQQAAQEEAQGAGVLLVSMYVTTTVTNEADLAAAISDIEARADQSKVRLRLLFGSQALGFATTLPVGIYPPLLSSGLPRPGR